MLRVPAALLLVLGTLGSAPAAPVKFEPPEETAFLTPGPDSDLAQGQCAACHSVDYITTQPRNVANPRAFWSAEVTKMQKVYGAPIDDEDAKNVVDYLVATYGK